MLSPVSVENFVLTNEYFEVDECEFGWIFFKAAQDAPRQARKEEITGKGTRKGRRHLTPRDVSQGYGAVLCHDSTIPLAASCGALGVAPMSPGALDIIESAPYDAYFLAS